MDHEIDKTNKEFITKFRKVRITDTPLKITKLKIEAKIGLVNFNHN